MRNLLNPKLLFVINTLPLVVLFLLFFGQFEIIKTLLNEDSIELWKSFGLWLGILGVLNLSYTLYLTLKKRNISIWYGVLSLLCYIPFIYLYGYHLDQILPFSIPQWMISGNIFLYVGTFLMPTLAYSLFIIVSHFTPKNKAHKSWVNFLIAIGIPILGYLFVQIILPLWQGVSRRFEIHTILILLITATIIFLFFLIRGVYILLTSRTDGLNKYQLAWKIPTAIILPVLGLLVNNGHLFSSPAGFGTGIFGDFNGIWFYLLVVLNGVLVCLPNLNRKTYRLVLFFARCITFAYTLYFFLVFLPVLPLSIIAIIAAGTGFLMLSPLVLFAIHLNELFKDLSYLKTFFRKSQLIGVAVVGFLIIPLFITVTYIKNKSVLDETLSYIYSPNYSKQYEIDKQSLEETLSIIKSHKDRRDSRGGIFGNGVPYLSSYFNWLVLDNLTLSDSKINNIEKIFFGSNTFESRSRNIQKDNVQISNIATESTYDSQEKAWRSWVNLEITNNSTNSWFSEYATTITLPEGCWISDYYLFVGDKKEPGILAEKKSAMWVFSQIRNTNRDPGILYYLTGNKVAFRVFPFAKNEVRKTGIQFLHKEPIELKIDNNPIVLGNKEQTIFENVETENIAYISAAEKQSLNTVKRDPYFHFMVDVSKKQSDNLKDFISRIEMVSEANKELSKNAKISFVNSYVSAVTLDSNWKDKLNKQVFEGGFYLDRAIKETLAQSYQSKSTSYPVIVAVTDVMDNAILEKNFSDFKFAFPESNLFYHLDKDGILREHSLSNNPSVPIPKVDRECMFCETVLEYQLADGSSAYLPNNNEPSIILKNHFFSNSSSAIKEKNWKTALMLQGQWIAQTLHPETSDEEWLYLVKSSFASKIMTPVTSYLVVENEAQKAMLKKKQKEVLSGNKSLDVGEDAQRMSEPSLIILTLLFGIILFLKEKKKRNIVNNSI